MQVIVDLLGSRPCGGSRPWPFGQFCVAISLLARAYGDIVTIQDKTLSLHLSYPRLEGCKRERS